MLERLLRDPALTYEKAKLILESADDVHHATMQKADVLATGTVRRDVNRAPKRENRGPRTKDRSSGRMTGHCFSCGGKHERKSCKFRDAECHHCHKTGHIKKVCRARQADKVAASVTIKPLDETDEDENYTTLAVGRSDHLYHTISVGDRSKAFIIDTGSPVSFLARSELSEWLPDRNVLEPTKATIAGVTGHNLKVLGEVRVEAMDAGQRTVPVNFLVTDRGPPVLGLDGLRALGVDIVLQTNVTPAPPGEVGRLLKACGSNSGGMDVPPVQLVVDESAEPKFCKARPMPFGLRPAVENNLKELVSDGILSPVKSSSWATPIVTPLKSNGVPRICGDYRITVNPALKQTATTTREVEEMFSGLKGQAFFSKIDLQNAFLQIPLDKASKKLTTVHTSWGLFQYNYLPFGLTMAPGLFQ